MATMAHEEDPQEAAPEEEAGEEEVIDMDEGYGYDDGEVQEESTVAELVEEPVTGTRYDEINTVSFDEFRPQANIVEQAQEAWKLFLSASGSRESAGLAIYNALFESAPSLQSLFVSPRAVAASKFLEGINSFVTVLDNPPSLKVKVETLCFGHLSLDVTVPRVIMFRDALLDLFQVELGDRLTTQAYRGWQWFLNYVGGAIIFIKAHYGERLRILDESWQLANKGEGAPESVEKGAQGEDGPPAAAAKGSKKGGEEKEHHKEEGNKTAAAEMGQNVPTTFNEMFLFNSAVMGFGSAVWMGEVLACFDNIVRNVSNTNRFQEECDVLVLRISKVTSKVQLADFKSCMLASLRSLLPKDWSTQHELAWCWFWENVERLLLSTMGKPPIWEKAWSRFLGSLDEAQAFEFRANIYASFFASCPAGQDYFKQSNTYLHLMAIKIMAMTVDMYREPVRMTDDISALGLRHVGYGIPTEHFGPWVTTWLEVLGGMTEDTTVIEGLRWSLSLVTKSLVRTIMEGSTIVMKAINVDNRRAMQNAIGCAPRGERASWMLKVQVGTQSISPLAWSIDSGALEAAWAMLNDLLTIRADRDRYYYGAEDMFVRHPDLVKKLIDNAPALLPDLLSGLIWRSRLTNNGYRRVNYYIKHLLVNPDGQFHQTLQWIVRFRDPLIVCHPTMVILADIVWGRVACRQFLKRKAWFMFTLILFAFDKGILEHRNDTAMDENGNEIKKDEVRYTVFIFRCFIYLFSFGSMLYSHLSKTIRAYKTKDLFELFPKVKFPLYLTYWQESLNLVLVFCLLIMLLTEPVLHCFGDAEGPLFNTDCDGIDGIKTFPYSLFAMCAMFLYFILLADLAVFNNSVTAYVLVCGRMLAELALFLFLAGGILVMFSNGLSCVHQEIEDFHGIPKGMQTLSESFLNMLSADTYAKFRDEPIILVANWCFMIILSIFLGNMLVAQLSCAYGTIYNDMVGYARLKRIGIITESMPHVSDKKWTYFVSTMKFQQKLEFNEGDIGIAGGIATVEAASAHPTNVDSIKRVGGSTSASMQWPQEVFGDEDGDKFERLEKALQKAMAQTSGGKGRKNKRARAGAASSSGFSGVPGGDGSWGDEEAAEDEM